MNINPTKRYLLLMITCLLVLTLGCALTLVSDPVPVPSKTIPLSSLLLDVSSFPQNWEISPCNSCELSSSGHVDRDFGIPDEPGHAVQSVYHFGNEEDAKAKFQRYHETTIASSADLISYNSYLADEEHIGCRIDEAPACYVGLRYGSFVIDFYFDVDNGLGYGLHVEEIENILEDMDDLANEIINGAS